MHDSDPTKPDFMGPCPMPDWYRPNAARHKPPRERADLSPVYVSEHLENVPTAVTARRFLWRLSSHQAGELAQSLTPTVEVTVLFDTMRPHSDGVPTMAEVSVLPHADPCDHRYFVVINEEDPEEEWFYRCTLCGERGLRWEDLPL